jgi:hypothetical protein
MLQPRAATLCARYAVGGFPACILVRIVGANCIASPI